MSISDELAKVDTIFIYTAIQISSAIDVGADVFITKDKKLKQIKKRNKDFGSKRLFMKATSSSDKFLFYS
jgi:predicted nucleic acid-binding protein